MLWCRNSRLYSLRWFPTLSPTSTMSTMELCTCSIKHCLASFWRQTNIKISRDLGCSLGGMSNYNSKIAVSFLICNKMVWREKAMCSNRLVRCGCVRVKYLVSAATLPHFVATFCQLQKRGDSWKARGTVVSLVLPLWHYQPSPARGNCQLFTRFWPNWFE